MFDEILKALKTDLLTEEQQETIKTKMEDIVTLKVKEKVDEALTIEKESLTEIYEQKFEDYKKDVTAKFSNFVDSILEEELTIPDQIVEFARKGELYSDLIEQFKVRIGIDENVLDEEAKTLLKEAKDEILKLQDELNQLHEEKLTLVSDAQEFASELYKREKCDGLTESQKNKVMSILEGINDKKTIDKKFNIIVESKFYIKEEDETAMNDCVCPECGKTSSSDKACSMTNCPECDVKMEDAKKEDTSEGKGQTEVKDDTKLVESTNSPFDLFKNNYLKVLKENRF
jgi:hypothetical protein